MQLFRSGAADEFNLFPVDTLAFEGRTLVGPVGTGQPLAPARPTFPTGTAGVVAVTGDDGLLTIEVPSAALPTGCWLTATATRLVDASPRGTSEFSRAVQVMNAPVLAVGTDGPTTTWQRELPYTVSATGTLLLDNLTAGSVSSLTGRSGGRLLLQGIDVVLTQTGRSTITRRPVADIVARGERVEVTLGAVVGTETAAPLAAGMTGTLMLADVSLPAARLYDASRLRGGAGAGPVSSPAVLLEVGAERIEEALADATRRGETAITVAERRAFVTRFQGGLRVASADFDGDGTIDLVTAPGAVPSQLVDPFTTGAGQTKRPLADAFGAATRVITIYNGRTDAAAKWASVSIDVSSFFPVPDAETATARTTPVQKQYAGGFLVAAGDMLAEGIDSRNGTAELVVASTNHAHNLALVFDVTVAAKGERPRITLAERAADGVRAPVAARILPLEAGRTVTGLAVAAFAAQRDQERNVGKVFADIAIASTAAVSDQLTRSGGQAATDTSQLRLYRDGQAGYVGGPTMNIVCPVEAGAPRTTTVNGTPVTTKVLQNAFLFGAGLAAGDVDNDLLPDLVLGARAGGLGNFRVIANDVVRTLIQPATSRAVAQDLLTRHLVGSDAATNRFAVAGPHAGRPTDNGGAWQPKGGTDFYHGKRVPTPTGAGFNAPLSVAVVERDGRSFTADVFAALGSSNQATELVRWIEWERAGVWRAGDALLVDDPAAGVVADPDSPNFGTEYLRAGRGLRLG
ncbi:MAG: hypothetical protein EBR86_15505 [Planctomycetia bacterium]|nr:hypothetical protein [Planctomycetia bacterium]